MPKRRLERELERFIWWMSCLIPCHPCDDNERESTELSRTFRLTVQPPSGGALLQTSYGHQLPGEDDFHW